jgi:ATP-dependent RNA helicase RhlE
VPSQFTDFELDPQILENLAALGYLVPTPIQKESIPAVLLGQDLMGLAQTGTGKTAAFLLPLLHRLMPGPRGHVRALILAPTRELAQQIHDAFGSMAKALKLRSVALYGGINITPQKEKIRRGAEVVIACPGRLLDHVRQRSVNLSKVEVLVLDEADHMFDVGFMPDVRQIMQLLPAKRQSLLFSATMPKEVKQLANEMLKNPTHVQIQHTAAAKTITQALYPVPQNLKTDLLIKLLQTLSIYSALVFTRTKHRAQRVAEQLEKAGYTATSLQGNLSQSKRQRALESFRSGKLQILVATDIASRGIDVASISHVFNYDMPDTVEAYTHRIGRTGRAAKLGDAFTLLAREDSAKLRTLERSLGTKIEQRMLPDFDYKSAPQSGSMQDDSARRFTDPRAGRPAAGKRPFGASQGDRTGSYRGKAKSTYGNTDKPGGYGRPAHASGNRAPEDRGNGPAGRARSPRSGDRPYADRGDRPARAPSSFGDRPYANRGDRPARAPSSFGDRPYADRGDRPARAPSSFGDRPYADRGNRPARAPSSFGDRPYANRGDRPARAPSSFGDRPYGNRGDRPARAPSSFGDRPYSDRGDRPAGRAKSPSSFGDRPYADRGDRPAGRAKSPSSFGDRPYADRGDRPAGRAKSSSSFGDRPASARKPGKTAFKPAGVAKKPFVHSKPKRPAD